MQKEANKHQILGFELRGLQTEFFNTEYFRFPNSLLVINTMKKNIFYFVANYIIVGFIGVILVIVNNLPLVSYLAGSLLIWTIVLNIKILSDTNVKKWVLLIINMAILYYIAGKEIFSVFLSSALLIGIHAFFIELPSYDGKLQKPNELSEDQQLNKNLLQEEIQIPK